MLQGQQQDPSWDPPSAKSEARGYLGMKWVKMSAFGTFNSWLEGRIFTWPRRVLGEAKACLGDDLGSFAQVMAECVGLASNALLFVPGGQRAAWITVPLNYFNTYRDQRSYLISPPCNPS